jgi:hypothetical protein
MEQHTNLAFSVRGFCKEHAVGRTLVYQEIREGRLRIMKVGRRTLISTEAAADWRRLMETPAEEAPDAT